MSFILLCGLISQAGEIKDEAFERAHDERCAAMHQLRTLYGVLQRKVSNRTGDPPS